LWLTLLLEQRGASAVVADRSQHEMLIRMPTGGSNVHLWVLLVEVEPIPGGPYEHLEAPGAYVNVTVHALTAEDARGDLADTVEEIGFQVVEVLETERYSLRYPRHRWSREIRELACRAEETGWPQVGSFYVYEQRDDDISGE
jgi:hypothetical protein